MGVTCFKILVSRRGSRFRESDMRGKGLIGKVLSGVVIGAIAILGVVVILLVIVKNNLLILWIPFLFRFCFLFNSICMCSFQFFYFSVSIYKSILIIQSLGSKLIVRVEIGSSIMCYSLSKNTTWIWFGGDNSNAPLLVDVEEEGMFHPLWCNKFFLLLF